MGLTLNIWDLGLVAVVSLQATVLAYLPQARSKAIVLSLPIPFTVATLAVGQRPDLTHILGLSLLFAYTHGVRLLHQRARLPIVPAIGVAAGGYCAAASLLAPRLPRDEATFWLASCGTFLLAAGLLRALPGRAEPDYRSPLPVWVKLPIVVAVVLGLVWLKGLLQGFMTLFPMVGVIASYEARHSLWTIGRQIPVLMLAMVPLIGLGHWGAPRLGLGASLLLGWLGYLAVFLFIAWRRRGAEPGA